MNWCTIILLVFSLAASFTYADDTQNCGKAQIKDVIKKVKIIIEEELQSKGNSPDAILQKLGLKLKEILSTAENTVGNCTPEGKLEFEHALAFASKMLSGETNPAEEVLPLVEDDQVLDDFTKLICEVNCSYVAEFATQLKHPSSKIRIYQTLMKFLQDTKLENKKEDTPANLPLIEVLINNVHQETDPSVEEVLKTLLRQAFRTELDTVFGNVEELYEIDPNLASEIIQQLIHESLIAQEKCGETGLGIMHVFNLIKCYQNISIWQQNLELVFNELKNTNKFNTINSVILLGYYEILRKDEDFNPYINKWQEIVKELPESVHKITSGSICCEDAERQNNIKAYDLDGNATEKLVPSEHSTKSAFSTVITGTKCTILVDYLPATDYKFKFPMEVEHGNLVALPKEEIGEGAGYDCLPLGMIFLHRKDDPETCILKDIIDALLNAAESYY